jgi:hypothetical protein
MDADIITEKLKDLNMDKLGKRAIEVAAGLIFGVLGVMMFSKFIEDNFDFRVAGISNKPPHDEEKKQKE